MVDLDPQALQAKGISPQGRGRRRSTPTTWPAHRHAPGSATHEYPVSAEQHAPTPSRRSTTSRSRSSTARRSTCATSPRSATASRRRPPSSAATASAAALLTLLKNGNASTLDIVNQVKALLPAIQAAAPPGLKIDAAVRPVAVRARRPSTACVHREHHRRPARPAAMILLFLGSWRSTLIVAVSIPLSILSSLIVLLRARPLAQRDDARRAGAGGRHPGRRRDGRDREHPPQPRPWASRCGRRSSTAPADRRADVRLDADDLHRVRLGAVPRRARRSTCSRRWRWPWCSRCWPRTCCRGRSCRRWSTTCCRPRSQRTRPTRARPRLVRPARTRRSSAASSGSATRYVARARVEPARIARRVFALLRRASWPAALRSLPFVGRDFFPTVDAGQFRLHVRAPAGHAPRGDRALLQPRSRTAIREIIPAGRGRADPRQHRPAQPQLQPWPSATAPRPARPTARSWSRSTHHRTQLDARLHAPSCARELPARVSRS